MNRPTFISPANPLKPDGVGIVMSSITWGPCGPRCSEWRLVWLLCYHLIRKPNLFPGSLQGGSCGSLHWRFHRPPALPFAWDSLFLFLLLLPHLSPPFPSTLSPNAVTQFCFYSTSLLENYSKKGRFSSGHFCFNPAAYPEAKECRRSGHFLRR